MRRRKYEVTGTDDLGDLHILATDDRERAEEVAEVMREDLEEVEPLNTPTGSAAPDG
jgi:hypothetical protein